MLEIYMYIKIMLSVTWGKSVGCFQKWNKGSVYVAW